MRVPRWSDNELTDDEGYHGGPIASCLFQAFDEFLHFPNFNILLRLVGLWGAHGERRRKSRTVTRVGDAVRL